MVTLRLVLVGACLLPCLACSGAAPAPATAEAQAAPETFTFAPALDRPFHYTQRRFEEVSVPGSPMRNSEDWLINWEVVTKQESNHFRRTLRLVGLKISVNGLDLLQGHEVKQSFAAIDVLTDKDANVVDIRGTDQLSEALVALASPEGRPGVARLFSPENLKALVLTRSRELNSDFVGRPTKVGSQWMANTPGASGTRQIRVVAEEPCGSDRCLRVVREYDVDRAAIQANVSAQVAAYVESRGADPSQVKVVGMDLKHEDSLLINPSTMEYHDAKFDEAATIHVSTPEGELAVAFKLQRSSSYEY